jgi:FkbM family methyltransferase
VTRLLNAPVLYGPARGHRFPVPRSLRRVIEVALGRYEIETARFLKAALRDADVFYDVGAATGYFSRFALHTMRHGTVVAVEPNPDAIARLKRLPIRVVPVAVGNEEAQATLFLRPGEDPRLARAVPRLADGVALATPEPIVVPVRTLDGLDLPLPDVMKIDVEGSEADALEGARRTLGHVQALVVECHSMPLLRDVLSVILDAGFDRVRVTEGGDYVGPVSVMALR